MKTRAQILTDLEQQYKEQFAGNGYPDEFKAQGLMTECNFGGMLIILSNDGGGGIYWSDWADNAISPALTEECIVYEESEDNDNELWPGFWFNECFYPLENFERIN